MKNVMPALIFSVIAITWLPTASANDEPPVLAHNPFSRPPAEASNIDREIADTDSRSGSTLTLRATMVGAAERLANVAGRILKAGDKIHGYRLISIHEEHAVFEKDGKLTTVHVKPQLVEDDD